MDQRHVSEAPIGNSLSALPRHVMVRTSGPAEVTATVVPRS